MPFGSMFWLGVYHNLQGGGQDFEQFSLLSDSRGLFDMFGLHGTATAIFRGRVGMYLGTGLAAADQLVRLLDGVAALNMERVRAEIEQETSARESLAVHRVCPATRRGKLE